MRILVTGASSPLAQRVVLDLLQKTDAEIWCAQHQSQVSFSHPRVRIVELDLESASGLTSIQTLSFDQVVHFAGVTHSEEVERYSKVNLEGTMRLAHAVRENGCRKFVFVSTRCATAGSGAYGESKLAAETQLKQLEWISLLIIRPAEVYGADGREGLDRILRLASRWHVVPAFWGNSRIRLAPIHVDDFTAIATAAIIDQQEGFHVIEASGPEELTGLSIAGRVGRRYFAVPVPVWWPGFAFVVKSLGSLGMKLTSPDQLDRLVSDKTARTASAEISSKMVRFLK